MPMTADSTELHAQNSARHVSLGRFSTFCVRSFQKGRPGGYSRVSFLAYSPLLYLGGSRGPVETSQYVKRVWDGDTLETQDGNENLQKNQRSKRLFGYFLPQTTIPLFFLSFFPISNFPHSLPHFFTFFPSLHSPYSSQARIDFQSYRHIPQQQWR